MFMFVYVCQTQRRSNHRTALSVAWQLGQGNPYIYQVIQRSDVRGKHAIKPSLKHLLKSTIHSLILTAD
jgi:hypothetical protein